jgi:hypothetical protein
MTSLTLNQALPPYQVIANNYATESTNRIHSDEVAAQYGFSGGLVPGVGNYAYLTRPVVEALGREWLERGAMAAKFLKPVYDGETVCVRGQVINVEPIRIQLELLNSAGVLCAVGEASLPASPPPLDPADYPERPLPAAEQRRAATLASVPPGMILGSHVFELSLAEMEAKFLADMREALPLYRGPRALPHPAALPAEANQILIANLALGPWIHTASEVQHYALPQDGERLSLRGRVSEAYEKRGHEFVVLDLGLFAPDARAVAHIKHTAIIRLRSMA